MLKLSYQFQTYSYVQCGKRSNSLIVTKKSIFPFEKILIFDIFTYIAYLLGVRNVMGVILSQKGVIANDVENCT